MSDGTVRVGASTEQRAGSARPVNRVKEASVSVIVPVYNGSRTIGRCLESLVALPDSPVSREILVVDNGSTDETVEIIRRFPEVRLLVEKETRGASAARNRGAREASGDILAFTDADCVVDPEWLTVGVAAFHDNGIAGVGGRIEGVESTNSIQEWMNDRRILDQERDFANPFLPYAQTANAFFGAVPFRAVDGFDASIPYGEDCDLSWRIQRDTKGRLVYEPDALVYHDHRASLGGLYRQSKKNAAAAAHLSRKWGEAYPPKRWKTSVWECYDLVRAGARYLRAAWGGALASEKENRRIDLLHRAGRKAGMIASAWGTRQWSRW